MVETSVRFRHGLPMNTLLKTLKENLCVITYEKIDTGEIREMECTLNPALIPNNHNINQQPSSDHILVWCTDRNAWRSFRVSTMKNYVIKLNG